MSTMPKSLRLLLPGNQEMTGPHFPSPRPGSLWTPCKDGPLMGTVLSLPPSLPPGADQEKYFWCMFENIAFLRKDDVLLYLGDKLIKVCNAYAPYHSNLYESVENYQELLAAEVLVEDRRVYLLYDDYDDIWKPSKHLTPILGTEENDLCHGEQTGPLKSNQ